MHWQPMGTSAWLVQQNHLFILCSKASSPAELLRCTPHHICLRACRQLLQAVQQQQALQGDPLMLEEVLDAPRLEQLLAQPGVAERLMPLLPDGRQNEV